MSYPPPPSVNYFSNGPSHPSLPARPPPQKPSKFKPAFAPTGTTATIAAATPSAYGAPPYQNPATMAPQKYGGSSYGGSTYGPAPPSMSAPGVYGAHTYLQSSSNGPAQPGPQTYYSVSAAAPPSIRNPFPAPGQVEKNSEHDPDMAAQIAQWQSAYSNPEASTAAAAAAATAGPVAYGVTVDPSFAPPPEHNEKKTVVRGGGGKKWSDDTLLEWDPSHFRLFVGNLAGETTDESLLKAFSRWSSVSKARVIRDKRTTKSKGYGFVSFSDADDFFQSAKEMNGKYIQSHPVIVKRSTTEIKTTNVKNSKGGNQHKSKNRGKNREGSFEPHLGPQPGGGIQKAGQKTKGGLKLLG